MKMMAAGLIMLVLASGAASNDTPYYSPEQQRELNRRANLNALDALFGDPNLVTEGIKRKEEVQKATYLPLIPPTYQPINKIQIKNNVSKINTVYVYPNQVTVVTITDPMGSPWPLSTKPINPSNTYKVSYEQTNPGLVTIETTSKYVPSSLVLPIEGKLRPIQLELRAIDEKYNYAVEITVEGRSPLNKTPIARPFGGIKIPEHDEFNIKQFLTAPPEGAVKLLSIGDRTVGAWRWRGKIIVKAPYQLMYPSEYIDVQSDIDEIERVYLMEKPIDVLSFLNQTTSKVINVEVQGAN